MTTNSDQTASPAVDDAALKQKHRALWALGSYSSVAEQVIPELGAVLVDAVAPAPGDRLLDVATGSGNAALPAARAGATVVASDLTPELFDAGRSAAEAAGVDVTWEQGDAEALPYEDQSFDVVISCVGVMFAPHHERSASELLRVCRSGGRLGLLNWTPGGFIGRMFAAMKPYAPAPPPGAQPPPLWGDEQHVRGLLGDGTRDLVATAGHARIDRFAHPQEFLDFFKAHYGPTIAVYRALADRPEQQAELDRALLDLAATSYVGDVMEWEYLLVTATTV